MPLLNMCELHAAPLNKGCQLVHYMGRPTWQENGVPHR